MQRVIKVLCVAAIIAFAGCRRGGERLAAPEYAKYYNSGAEDRNIIAGGIKYTIRLMPAELMALEAAYSTNGLDNGVFQKRFAAVKSNTYFIIKIQTDSTAPEKEQTTEAAVQYYQTDAKNNIKLIAANQLFKPEYINYENNYGLSPYNTVVACFEVSQKELMNGFVFSYDDILHNNPAIKAAYTKKEIEELPTLKY